MAQVVCHVSPLVVGLGLVMFIIWARGPTVDYTSSCPPSLVCAARSRGCWTIESSGKRGGEMQILPAKF
jgi:hypothetical protein